MLVIKSLLILCSAAVVLAQTNTKAVVSGAIFVGEDTTDPTASPLEVFKEPLNHASAVSSVLVFSAKQSNFFPSTQPPKSLILTLNGFIEKVSTFPGFVLESSEESSLPLTGPLVQLEQVIRESNPSYHHQALVARSIRDLMPGFLIEKDAGKWVLNLVVLDKHDDSDTVTAGIVTVTLTIDRLESGIASIPKQQAKMVSSIFRANKTFLISYAENLSKSLPIVSIRDFLDYFTSPKVEEEDEYRTIAATPCTKNTAFVNQGQRSLYNWQNGV